MGAPCGKICGGKDSKQEKSQLYSQSNGHMTTSNPNNPNQNVHHNDTSNAYDRRYTAKSNNYEPISGKNIS